MKNNKSNSSLQRQSSKENNSNLFPKLGNFEEIEAQRMEMEEAHKTFYEKRDLNPPIRPIFPRLGSPQIGEKGNKEEEAYNNFYNTRNLNPPIRPIFPRLDSPVIGSVITPTPATPERPDNNNDNPPSYSATQRQCRKKDVATNTSAIPKNNRTDVGINTSAKTVSTTSSSRHNASLPPLNSTSTSSLSTITSFDGSSIKSSSSSSLNSTSSTDTIASDEILDFDRKSCNVENVKNNGIVLPRITEVNKPIFVDPENGKMYRLRKPGERLNKSGEVGGPPSCNQM